MSIEIIKTLIHEFNGSDLTKLKLSYEDFQLELEKEKEVVHTVVASEQQVVMATTSSKEVVKEVAASMEPEGTSIKSPMVGTFYSASSPDRPPFVEVGSKVKRGDVICIIEAMKLMNEIEAEVDGEIVAIHVSNEQMVAYDTPLFTIKEN